MADRRTANLLERVRAHDLNATPIPGESQETHDALAAVGYRSAQQRINGNALIDTLKKLGYMPFVNASVEKYKLARVKEAHSDPKRLPMKILAVLTVVSLVVGLVAYGTALFSDDGTVPGTIALIASAVFILSAVFTSMLAEHYGEFSWICVSIKAYTPEIPMSVANMIAAIHRELPEATFEIDYLAKHYTPTFDPFLVVKYGDKAFYIAVWDEPKFSETPMA